MRCDRVRELIALQEHGDATAAELKTIAAHLATCTGCIAFAAAPAPEVARYREHLPVSDVDFARIRANVMATASARSRRASIAWGRPIAALAAVFVLAFAGLLTWRRPASPAAPDVTTPRPAQVIAPQPTLPPAPADEPTVEALVDRQPETPRQIERRTAVRTVPPRKAQTAGADETTATEVIPLVIEIHTADPDVRILWIGSQPAAATNPTIRMED